MRCIRWPAKQRVCPTVPTKTQLSNFNHQKTSKMKKVININFHSRVIPIEESAYEILKQYSDSLRKYFANEEGRDEIINDIESRIAELFSEHLKKGASCITDDDVTGIIASMGRPEDFEAADADSPINGGSSAKQQATAGSQQEQQRTYAYTGRGR